MTVNFDFEWNCNSHRRRGQFTVTSVKGLAKIYDKDIPIYALSQLIAKMKRSEPVGPRLRITSYDLLGSVEIPVFQFRLQLLHEGHGVLLPVF